MVGAGQSLLAYQVDSFAARWSLPGQSGREEQSTIITCHQKY